MSLINRMLRDLSARERKSGDVLSGIEVPRPLEARRGPSRARLGLFAGLIALFTLVIWLLLPKAQRPAPPPEAAPVAAAPAVAPAGGTSADGRHDGLELDLTLSTVPSGPPASPAPRRARRGDEDAARSAPARDAPATALTPAERLGQPPEGPPAARPAPPPTRDTKAAAQRHADATAALRRGEDRTAEESLLAALALDPHLHAAREDLGTLYVRHGRLDEAERTVRAGLAESPQWVGYRRLAARLELARNNGAAAVALLERDAPTIAADPEYHGLLASAYQRVGRHADAARAYQGLSQLQPGIAQWWAGYGLSRDALGDAPGALAAYAQARSLGGLDARVLEHINRRSAVLSTGG